MKRHVLFIGYDSTLQEEIKEFFKERGGQAWFTSSTDRSVRVLSEHPVETVVLSLHTLKDAAILKYINQYFPDIKILVSASHEYEEIINVLSHGHFEFLPQPLKLKELGALL